MKTNMVEVRTFDSKDQSKKLGLGKSIGFAKTELELEKLLKEARKAPFFLVRVRKGKWWENNFHLIEFPEKVAE